MGELFLFRRPDTYQEVLRLDSNRWPTLSLIEQFARGDEGREFEDIRHKVHPLIGK